MIRPGFRSASDRRELEASVRRQREDRAVARPANAILLLDNGKSCQAIAEFLYLDDDSIRGGYKSYREAGWDALSVDGWKRGQSRMTSAQGSRTERKAGGTLLPLHSADQGPYPHAASHQDRGAQPRQRPHSCHLGQRCLS